MPDWHFVRNNETLYQALPERLTCVNCCQKFGAVLRDRLSRPRCSPQKNVHLRALLLWLRSGDTASKIWRAQTMCDLHHTVRRQCLCELNSWLV